MPHQLFNASLHHFSPVLSCCCFRACRDERKAHSGWKVRDFRLSSDHVKCRNGAWQTLAASASTQGMSKSRSGRYEIHHERQFHKMDSIVNHYAAKRVGGGASAEKIAETNEVAQPNSGAASTSNVRMTASTSTSQRPRRVDASTSTRSLAAMARSTSSTRKASLSVQRRPLPIPPVSQTKLPPSLAKGSSITARQASSSTEAPRTKRLRLAVSEDQNALQNTVLEIPPEKKSVTIRVTRPEREGMPYKI